MEIRHRREVNKMLRVLALMIVTGSLFTTGYAQSSRQSEARYFTAHGRCGPQYRLENAPAYFYHPKTTSQILDVIRTLRAAPPQSDVQCRDYTDAWAPYLFADRKIRIASLLMKLKRYDEAREELWSLFLREGVPYRGEKLYYDMGTAKAISLLMSNKLWNVEGIERRLRDPKYFVERIKAAHDRRKRLA